MNLKSLQQAATVIRSGGVVAYPTEYCYGLGCDPSQPQAVRKILRLKYRRQYKGLILIAHRLSVLHRHVDSLPEKYREEILDSWPGPFTGYCPHVVVSVAWFEDITVPSP